MQLTPLPLRRDYHVTFDRTMMFWQVKQEYRSDTLRYTLTKTEALGFAIEAAREAGVSVVIHGMDGRIRQVWSYDSWMGPRDALKGSSSVG